MLRCKLAAAIAVTVLASCGTVVAETILIDFNGTASTPTLGGTWNTIDSPSATPQLLLDTTGTATSVTLTATGDFGDSTITNSGWTRSWVDTAAVADYFYMHGVDLSSLVVLDGLDDHLRYDIELVSSRSPSVSQGTDILDIQVQGVYTTSEISSDDYDCYNDGYVNQTILIWKNVAPTNDQIAISLDTESTGYVFLNAVQLTVVPEPSTTLLLWSILAAGMVLSGRRRPTHS